MRRSFLSATALVLLASAFVPRPGDFISAADRQKITGGDDCEVTDFLSCSRPASETGATLTDVCAQCQQQQLCTSSGLDDSCVGLTAGAACENCGTCTNLCGGSIYQYSDVKCSGTSVNAGACGRSYTEAMTEDCNGTCPPS